jgi:hypothetical protein
MISANWHGVVVDSVGVTGVLVNSAGFDGVAVGSAGWHGLEVGSAHGDGVLVGSAGDDGLFVAKTGSAAAYVGSANHNGVEIGNAEHDAVYVDSAGDDGLRVCRTGSATSCSYNTLDNGVEIGNAAGDGVLVLAAGYNGVWAHTTRPGHDYGFYTLDRIYAGTTLLQSLSLVAQVDGPDALTPGDLVAAAGVADPLPGSLLHVPLVRLAGGKSLGLVGVVETRLALEQAGELLPADDDSAPIEPLPPELHSAEGPAQPGDYVAITIYGAAQVKVDGAAAIEAGQRLTASSTPGQARALRALKVQLADGAGAADMFETAPVIGVALDAPRNGLAWVLVNPQ